MDFTLGMKLAMNVPNECEYLDSYAFQFKHLNLFKNSSFIWIEIDIDTGISEF